ncbi:Uncharacterised protein [Mycobacterium tuberculosis]|nr:Uncharacterised protein [Mycobacterium tuberculosis]CKR19833.1 Uncharacterised protein [Mycobacterium tuberculosis]CNV40081.1 Uncharacterised protein [Mycobacterium tuberculosis]
MHPSIGARRPSQCCIGVATDQDRDRLGGRRGHLGLGYVVELAVELEVIAGGKATHDLDAFVNPLAALSERDAHQLVILRPRASADTQPDPVADQGG